MIDVSIGAIAKRLATQDNACTAHPIFVVQQRERIYGICPSRAEGTVWLNDEGDELEPPATFENEEDLRETGAECVGYQDRWAFVQPFFTRAAAEAYIEANRHRLTDPRVWVDSAYRNPEWQAIVACLPLALRCIRAAHAVAQYIGAGQRRDGWDLREAKRRLSELREALNAL